MSDFAIKRGDTEPAIIDTLSRDGVPIDLSGCTVRFLMRFDKNTLKVNEVATIANATGGIVRYDWQTADTANHGNYRAEWEVTRANGKKFTVPTRGWIDVRIDPDLGP